MTKMITQSQVSSNRRITIPPKIAKRLDLGEHDILDFIIEESGRIYIKKVEA